MSAEVSSGTVVGGYRIVSLIGSGAMGSVYLAEDPLCGRRVALKVLVSGLDRDDRFRQRFLQESELVASLDHPNIVPTLGSGEDDGRLFLAMAYVEGSDLRELLRQDGRLEPARALTLLGQVAGALDVAHEAGLVHRDVNPGNILVAGGPEDEHAYICDFGLARHVSSVSSLTGERGFVGTIDYVPPEQIEGSKIDGRADVYSLGCVLYECLAAVRPFDRESELSVVFAHLNEPPPRITELRPELPRPFDDVFATALAKDPADRYATCAELVEAGLAARRGKVIRRRASRRRWTLVAGAMLLGAGVTIGGVLATQSDNTAATRAAITQESIDGARVGLTEADYQKLFGGTGVPVVQPKQRRGAPSTNWPTLAFDNQKLWIFFGNENGPTKRATVIVTWNSAFKTARGIGPCSTIADMEKVYGHGTGVEPDSFAVMPSGVFTYDVGNNLLLSAFGRNVKGAPPSKTITAIGLFDGTGADAEQFHPYAGFVTGNETPKCAK
jgi:serine/threonine-protein kinase